jgi:hypothetical protein
MSIDLEQLQHSHGLPCVCPVQLPHIEIEKRIQEQLNLMLKGGGR